MIPLLLLILAAPLGATTVFTDAPGEMGPGMTIVHEVYPPITTTNYDQTVSLHPRWNLVSWHIEPLPQPFTMQDILPNPSWFTEAGGELYQWNYRDLFYPDPNGLPPTTVWDLNYAYYMWLDAPHNWNEFPDRPRFAHDPIDMQPSDAWTYDPAVGDEHVRWFFLGYSTPGYMKLASIPNIIGQSNGDPQYFDYEGPLHWLIWYNSDDPLHPEYPDNFPPWDLKIVKTDDGKCYVPTPAAPERPYDNIGVLEPGRGYFLGFYCGPGRNYTFDGWPEEPIWTNNSIEPPPPGAGAQICSGAHFQFTPFTHWFYPILIDTVDLEQTPLAMGDEIAVFDGELCVGSVAYQGTFPLQLNAWEDDIATPDTLDGYIIGQPMTFKWYDASANSEAEFVLPPGTQSVEDDPVAPTHSGFGRGAYGSRSFCDGIQSVQPLPQAFRLSQNFPNPFNSETVIPLELPQRSHVKLEIFNVKGQRLGIPFEHTYDAGWPKIRWNATKLPSGIYFYRITAEGLERGGKFVDAGKMLVLK